MPIDDGNATHMSRRSAMATCLPASSSAPPVPHESFMALFDMFATASAGTMCSYGGGSIYRGQFSVDNRPMPVVTAAAPPAPVALHRNNREGGNLSAFSYMIVSTANPTQQDYIDAYKQSRRAAQFISDATGIDVWPYSVSFVFFDQYLTIVPDTWRLVGGNIVVQLLGLMQPLGIMLNGLSLVNLIIAVGVSVEFCSHFVRVFAKATGTGDQRVQAALRKVLASVLFGITLTKMVGLSALTLADSRIFHKYYFRMYMALVLCGVLNGMVLLPVVLSVTVDVQQFVVGRREEQLNRESKKQVK